MAVRKYLTVKKFSLLLTLMLLQLVFIVAGQAYAATYYIAPNGSDSAAGTSAAPWATFAHAMSVLQPGDTLLINDGSYNYPNVLDITVSGTDGNPITIKAVNDGKVVIDGKSSGEPCVLNNISHIDLEGVVCQNAQPSYYDNYTYVVETSGSSYITMRRVSAYGYANSGYGPMFGVNGSNHVLLEDTVGYGSPREIYNIQTSNYATIRRALAKYSGTYKGSLPSGYDPTGDGIQVYGSAYNIVENCVIDGTNNDHAHGIDIWSASYSAAASNNKIYGNVVLNNHGWGLIVSGDTIAITGNDLENNVLLSPSNGIRQGGDSNLTIKNNTVYNTGSSEAMLFVSSFASSGYPGGYAMNLYERNSSYLTGSDGGFFVDSSNGYIGTMNVDYNNYYNVTQNSLSSHDSQINPDYDTATYGNGAYLMVPSALKGMGQNGTDIGATVLHQYEDGALTATPLWPWPMEGRVLAETGISPTYSAQGGIWKTLDGVYSTSGPTAPPAATPPAATPPAATPATPPAIIAPAVPSTATPPATPANTTPTTAPVSYVVDPPSSPAFSDVAADNWAYGYINALHNARITRGCGNNNYCPAEQVTRAQMAAFIIRALYGENFAYTATPYFSDVPSTDGFFKYIQKMKDLGITASNGLYAPDSIVTRAQIAAFLVRARQVKNNQGPESFTVNNTTTAYFSDVPTTDPYFLYVQKLKEDGITTVTGTYNADIPNTRDETAAMLSRAFLGMK